MNDMVLIGMNRASERGELNPERGENNQGANPFTRH